MFIIIIIIIIIIYCAINHRHNYSLAVHRTSLESLGLVSLESIESGDALVRGNSRLCYVKNISWHQIVRSSHQSTRMIYESDLCSEYRCNAFYRYFSK